MKAELKRSNLLIKKSPIHGYGVFAGQKFAEGEVIEECLPLFNRMQYPEFGDYYFEVEETTSALLLGCGSLYNHSMQPNATYHYDEEENIFVFTAKRPISKNEEIVVYYGENWFKSRALRLSRASWSFRIRKWIKKHWYLVRFLMVATFLVVLLKWLAKN